MSTKRAQNRQDQQKSAAPANTEGAPGPSHLGTREAMDPNRPSSAPSRPAPILDDFDTAILRYLARHGRATNYEVGEAVGLSASAASRRILALESSGAIRGYRAVIDDRLLGKHMTVYIRVTLERQSAAVLSAFEAAVRHCHDIVSCHLLAGQVDYILVARVAGMDDYGRLHQTELSRLPGVTRLETSFALRDVLEGKSA
jgi:Lrp/AsnC family transcriptional regulator, leucine-responsive regulatory protein